MSNFFDKPGPAGARDGLVRWTWYTYDGAGQLTGAMGYDAYYTQRAQEWFSYDTGQY